MSVPTRLLIRAAQLPLKHQAAGGVARQRDKTVPRFISSTSSIRDTKQSGSSSSSVETLSSGKPARRIPADRRKESAHGSKSDRGRVTAASAVPPGDSYDDYASKGKGKATASDNASTPMIGKAGEGGLDMSVLATQSDVNGPTDGFGLDVAKIPRLRSSFEDPLMGLSPAFASQPPASSSISPSTTTTTNAPQPSIPTKPTATTPSPTRPLPPHLFNTHHFAQQLESASFSSPLSSTLLQATQSILSSCSNHHLTSSNGGIVSSSYSEGQAYLYSAALSELRTEVQVKARNDGIALRSVVAGLQREVDAITQRLKEDVGTLRGDIQLEMGNRKEEASTDCKTLELRIQELNSKFTILVGEVRTEIETRKWVTTRRCIVAIAGLALCVVLYTASSQTKSSSSRSKSRLKPFNSLHHDDDDDDEVGQVKSVEELGIQPTGAPAGGEGWVFVGGKRLE